MVDRPPVKHAGTLPEGAMNGYSVVYDLLAEQPDREAYVLARVRRTGLKHVDATGIDEVSVKIVEIEPLVGGKMPTDFDHAGEALQAIRADRTGVREISRADARDIAELADLRRQLESFRDRSEMSTSDLGALVLDTVPGAGPGWRDDPRIIREFLATRDELDEEALADAMKPADVDEDSPEEVGGLTAATCPDWAAHVDHGPHGWISEDDGQVYCPGWDADPDNTPTDEVGADGDGQGSTPIPDAAFSDGHVPVGD